MTPEAWTTADLCDAHEEALASGSLRVLTPGLIALGKRIRFCGPAATLKLFEDNSLLAEAVKRPGDGRVLVVDAGGSMRCAVLGGNLAAEAARRDWNGVLVYGCVRDCEEINATELGVRALALHPRRSVKRGEGQRDIAVSFLGAAVMPGDWIYADADGVLVSATRLLSR